jgi:hypothetical protein
MEDQAWVTVLWCDGMLDAQLVKGKLESEDIPVLLKYEAVGHIYGLTRGGLGRVEIRVPKEYEEQAREALEEDTGLADDDLRVNGNGGTGEGS